MQHNVLAIPQLLAALTAAAFLLVLVRPAPQVHADGTGMTYAPLVSNGRREGATPPPPAPDELARDHINSYRSLAGVPLVQLHPALTLAAQKHASYTALNATDQSAWSYGPHGEVASKPGFSGQWPTDRGLAARFPYSVNDEVIAPYDHPTRAVDYWMDTVFHRVGVLDPKGQYVGYGHGRDSRGYGVDVVDMGKGASDPSGDPDVIVYPAPEQIDIPLYGASEEPHAVPPDGHYPIGYPVTIQPFNGDILTVSRAELHDSRGAPIDIYPNPPLCGSYHCYALIPVDGLGAATTYTVHVAGTVNDVPFDKTWSFTTTSCTVPGFC
jgi:hypothetical protein